MGQIFANEVRLEGLHGLFQLRGECHDVRARGPDVGSEPDFDATWNDHPLSHAPDAVDPSQPDRYDWNVESTGQHCRAGLKAFHLATADPSALREDD